MTIIGEAFVAVRPETAGFGTSTESMLTRAVGAIPAPAIFAGFAAAGIGAALDIGEHFESAYRSIRSATGATEAQMGGLEDAFKDVLKSGPASMEQVADSLSLVSQRTKMTGDDLEGLTESELKLSRITGGDVKNIVDETTKVFANWGIKGIGPSKLALDELLSVSQHTGISLDSLATSVVGKAGATFRELGVSMTSAATILGTLEAAGVNTSPVIMGLSKAVTEAQKQGKDAHGALADLFGVLKDGVPGTQAYSDAIATLGSRGFLTLSEAVKSGKISIDDFSGSADATAAGTVDRIAKANQTLGGLFKTLKNEAMVALEPIGMAVLQFANVTIRGAVDVIRDAFATVGPYVSQVFDVLFHGDFHGGPFAEDSPFIANLFTVRDVLGTLGSDVRTFVQTLFSGNASEDSPVAQFALTLREDLLPVLQTVADFVRDHWQPILIGAGVGLALLMSPILTIAAGLVLLYARSETFRNIVDSTVQTVAMLSSGLADRLGPAMSAAADLAGYFVDRWDKIRVAVETVMKIFAVMIAVTLAPLIFVWTHFHDQILAVAQLVWDQVGAIVSTFVRVIGDAFDFIVSILSGQWGDAWNDVKDIFGAAVDYLQASLGNLLAFIVDFFSSLPANMLGALGDLGGYFLDIGQRALGGLLSGLQAGVPALGLWLLGLPLQIVGLVHDADQWLIKTGFDVLTGLLTGLVQKFVDLNLWFLGLPGQIIGGLPDALLWLKQLGVNVLTGMAHGIFDAWDGLRDWFLDTPNRLKSELGNVGSWLVNLGSDIISGLKHGIDAAWHDILQFVKDKGTDLIHTITHPWESLSPSRVTMRLGRNIADGLRIGFSDGMHAMFGTIDSLNAQTKNRVADVANSALGYYGKDRPWYMGGIGGGGGGGLTDHGPTMVTLLSDVVRALREQTDLLRDQQLASALAGLPNVPLTFSSPPDLVNLQTSFLR